MLERDESRTELGSIKIHRNVVSNIASIAASEVEGVKGIGRDIKSRIRELLGRKTHTSIQVDFDQSSEVTLTIPLIIKYGYNIPEVAQKAQENIHNALDRMTNLIIKDINIKVQGIDKE